MKIACQIAVLIQIVVFFFSSMRGALRKLHPDKPPGCFGIFAAITGAIFFFLIFWKAGAFTVIFPFLYPR